MTTQYETDKTQTSWVACRSAGHHHSLSVKSASQLSVF